MVSLMRKKALVINCSPVRSGATAAITGIIAEELEKRFETRRICIDDYEFTFCRGCRSCHETAKCILNDDVLTIIKEFEWADVIVAVAPSYWADVPGQFKCFIDRCTPWSNTHEPHAVIGEGKKGYAVTLRTGPNMKECERLINTIEHFYGHMEIERCGSLGLCSVSDRDEALARKDEITDFCEKIK
ncbi:MAG: flavodoxin family protein [Ruminococcus sp.]|nr:flavodoxin family protein [Ruminococcus sp.]